MATRNWKWQMTNDWKWLRRTSKKKKFWKKLAKYSKTAMAMSYICNRIKEANSLRRKPAIFSAESKALRFDCENSCAEWTNSTRQSAQFDTSNRKTRQASPKWTELTNQNHENEHKSLELNESFFCRWQSYRLLCMQRLIFFEALWKLAFKMHPNNSNSSST